MSSGHNEQHQRPGRRGRQRAVRWIHCVDEMSPASGPRESNKVIVLWCVVITFVLGENQPKAIALFWSLSRFLCTQIDRRCRCECSRLFVSTCVRKHSRRSLFSKGGGAKTARKGGKGQGSGKGGGKGNPSTAPSPTSKSSASPWSLIFC